MNLEIEKISKTFREKNKYWNLELPKLKNEFSEFELQGAFGYSYCVKIDNDKIEYIDFKTNHRMSGTAYIRYYKDGKEVEPMSEILRNSSFEFTNEKDFDSITRLKNIGYTYEHNKLKEIEFDYNEYEFFWRNESPFSQWYKASFELNGVEYTSAEQFMMSKKAELFEDEEIKNQILSTNNVRKQKVLGRKVRNFDENIWNQNKIKIVYIANNLKFNQNPALKSKLLESEGKYIVEASPVDSIWGIGLADDDPKRFNKENWRGQNLLGKILTQLRADIITMGKYQTHIE